MEILDRYRKRRAIRAFSKRLGPALVARFGHTSHYSANQIDEVASGRFHRHREFLAYAYCLFMAPKDFEAMGGAGDFDRLRGEVFEIIGPGPALGLPGQGAIGDAFQGPSPGDFDPGDGAGF